MPPRNSCSNPTTYSSWYCDLVPGANSVRPPEKIGVPVMLCAWSRSQFAGLCKHDCRPARVAGVLAGQPAVGLIAEFQCGSGDSGLVIAKKLLMYERSSESDRTARSWGIFSVNRPKLAKIFVLRLPQGSTMMPARGDQLPVKL